MIEYESQQFAIKPLPLRQQLRARDINVKGGHGPERIRVRAILKSETEQFSLHSKGNGSNILRDVD